MKVKAAVSFDTPQEVVDTLESADFAKKIISQVMGDCLGAKDPLDRPAEFYVQAVDLTVQAQRRVCGAEVRLTGATRNGRTPKQIHGALKVMHGIIKETILEGLQEVQEKDGEDFRIQMFAVIMLDADIETAPGSGEYSNVIESDAEWLEVKEES